MIEAVYLDPVYWLIFLAALCLYRVVIGFKILDFKFLIGMYLSQYVAHLTLVFGLSTYLVFCVLFIVAFVLGYHGYATAPNLILNRGVARHEVDERVVRISRFVLFAYYTWRIASVPIWSGALDLAARLQRQQENRAIFFLGIVMVPLFVAFMYDCVRKEKFGRMDWLLIAVTAFGALSTGSKITFLPLILSYIGVSSYLGRRIPVNPWVVVGFLGACAIILYTLLMYFPTLSFGEIVDLMLYRVVANTDNIEYLYTLNLTPDQYPFSGAVSFVPFISKYLGAAIDFPYGVWLHGMRYGDWDGFGPNAGFLVEQYGNLGWGGLVVGVGLGVLVRWTLRVPSAYRVMILSFSYTLLVESTIFFMNLIFCTFVLMLAFGINKLRKRRYTDIGSHQRFPAGIPSFELQGGDVNSLHSDVLR
jgi:hypothetical protein